MPRVDVGHKLATTAGVRRGKGSQEARDHTSFSQAVNAALNFLCLMKACREILLQVMEGVSFCFPSVFVYPSRLALQLSSPFLRCQKNGAGNFNAAISSNPRQEAHHLLASTRQPRIKVSTGGHSPSGRSSWLACALRQPSPWWVTRASLPALSPVFKIVALQPLLQPPPQDNY